jgi:hypothetical protein
MSLTSFLKDDGELRILIDETFEKPEAEIEAERLAEPQTTNYSLIGTAFDYVLRFKLEKHYDSVDSKPWVAHNGVSLAYLTDMTDDLSSEQSLEDILTNAERIHQDYLETGEVTDELLVATLDLARLDWIYRSMKLSDEFGEANESDIKDLRRLYEIVPENEFLGADTVLLNPTFGSASKLVGGADADIVLDSTLIDIKTVKEAKLKPEYWRQLVGYAILADIASDELEHMPEFTEVGIYFSRHGTLWRTSATQIYEHEKYEQFKKWFKDRAESHFKNE